jgi:hypothetical protein
VLLAIYNYVLPNAIGVVHPDAPSEIVSIVCQGIWPTPNLENSALKKRKKKRRRVHADAHAYAYADADANAGKRR